MLKHLAAFQATKFDAASDAEPGKILHEIRGGEMATLKEVPFGLYYGAVDSTPLFLILLGLYVERTGDEATLRALWPAAERALEWMDQSGDLDGDGFLEYRGSSEGVQHGLRNQGWKNSIDAVFHADGALAEGPIALCEVQGYAYAAKRLASQCAARLGDGDTGAKAGRRGRRPRPPIRRGVLVRGPRRLRAGAGRQEAAVPRPLVERRPGLCGRASPAPIARAASPTR